MLALRYGGRDHVEVIGRSDAGKTAHVADIYNDGLQIRLELGVHQPPGFHGRIEFAGLKLNFTYHRVDIPGRAGEWYTVEGDPDRYDSPLQIVKSYVEKLQNTGSFRPPV